MVVMEIHSRYGKLVCQPMTLQAIENSISESEPIEQNQDLEGESDGAESTGSPASATSD